MILSEKETGVMSSALMSYINTLRYKLENNDLGYMEGDILKRKIKEAEQLAVRAEDH